MRWREAIQRRRRRQGERPRFHQGRAKTVACRKNRSAAEIARLEGSPEGRPEADQKRDDDCPEGGRHLELGRPGRRAGARGNPRRGQPRATQGNRVRVRPGVRPAHSSRRRESRSQGEGAGGWTKRTKHPREGKEYSRQKRVKLPVRTGICEGGAGKPAFLPQRPENDGSHTRFVQDAKTQR